MFFWSKEAGVKLGFIQLGKPTHDAFVESLDSKFRNECLNQHWFRTVEDARYAVDLWREHYNPVRAHSSLNYLPPVEYAKRAVQYEKFNRKSDATSRKGHFINSPLKRVIANQTIVNAGNASRLGVVSRDAITTPTYWLNKAKASNPNVRRRLTFITEVVLSRTIERFGVEFSQANPYLSPPKVLRLLKPKRNVYIHKSSIRDI
ncbi:transposase [Salinimonas sediminis]|uniref:Transposase n=1 Tax=Salinimonas sediminis TaxID=2303538 RepID=A0A346NQN3_9ALTE|nr:transposase [Salinimonas sediminis]